MKRENDDIRYDGEVDFQRFLSKTVCSNLRFGYDDIVVAEDVKRQLEEPFTARSEKVSDGFIFLYGSAHGWTPSPLRREEMIDCPKRKKFFQKREKSCILQLTYVNE